ncbi:hypothetical protein EI555_008800, partial [Monodon monoceros]
NYAENSEAIVGWKRFRMEDVWLPQSSCEKKLVTATLSCYLYALQEEMQVLWTEGVVESEELEATKKCRPHLEKKKETNDRKTRSTTIYCILCYALNMIYRTTEILLLYKTKASWHEFSVDSPDVETGADRDSDGGGGATVAAEATAARRAALAPAGTQYQLNTYDKTRTAKTTQQLMDMMLQKHFEVFQSKKADIMFGEIVAQSPLLPKITNGALGVILRVAYRRKRTAQAATSLGSSLAKAKLIQDTKRGIMKALKGTGRKRRAPALGSSGSQISALAVLTAKPVRTKFPAHSVMSSLILRGSWYRMGILAKFHLNKDATRVDRAHRRVLQITVTTGEMIHFKKQGIYVLLTPIALFFIFKAWKASCGFEIQLLVDEEEEDNQKNKKDPNCRQEADGFRRDWQENTKEKIASRLSRVEIAAGIIVETFGGKGYKASGMCGEAKGKEETCHAASERGGRRVVDKKHPPEDGPELHTPPEVGEVLEAYAVHLLEAAEQRLATYHVLVKQLTSIQKFPHTQIADGHLIKLTMLMDYLYIFRNSCIVQNFEDNECPRYGNQPIRRRSAEAQLGRAAELTCSSVCRCGGKRKEMGSLKNGAKYLHLDGYGVVPFNSLVISLDLYVEQISAVCDPKAMFRVLFIHAGINCHKANAPFRDSKPVGIGLTVHSKGHSQEFPIVQEAHLHQILLGKQATVQSCFGSCWSLPDSGWMLLEREVLCDSVLMVLTLKGDIPRIL